MIRGLVYEDKGYSFLKSVKGSAAYWKILLYDVYFVIKVEFQARGSPHNHCFLWLKDAPVLNAVFKFIYKYGPS